MTCLYKNCLLFWLTFDTDDSVKGGIAQFFTVHCNQMGPYKGFYISSVDIGIHLVANYQCKKGSRCVEITGFQVWGSSVGGARRFSSTRPLQYLSKFETMTGPCQNLQRP